MCIRDRCNGDGADEGFDCAGNCVDAATCGSATLAFGAVTDSSVEILYDSNFDIGGFQFTASGVEVTGASSSLENVSSSSTTGVVVGFSLSGSSLAAGSGSLAVLEFAATSAGSTLDVSNVVLSSSGGVTLASSGPGSVAIDGCADADCNGDCGGSAVVDECGVCDGSGIADGACDCDGNVADCAGVCGGSSLEDDCGVCDGTNDCLDSSLSLGAFDA